MLKFLFYNSYDSKNLNVNGIQQNKLNQEKQKPEVIEIIDKVKPGYRQNKLE